MAKSIVLIYKSVIVDKIFIFGIVRGIDVDNVNLASMGLFQQSETMKVIAFKKKIDSACGSGDFFVRAFSKYGNVIPHLYINGFFVAFPHEAVFLCV